MVLSCFVPRCTRNCGPEDKSYFRFPGIISHQGEETKELSSVRRAEWIAAVGREKLPTQHSFICSLHFISGVVSIVVFCVLEF